MILGRTKWGINKGRMPAHRTANQLHGVKGGEKTCHWGGVKLYHLGGA